MAAPHIRPTRIRYIVLFGLCLAAAIAYLHRSALGSAQTTIRADIDISKKETSWALSCFFLTYAIFQIPTGILVDRWGARRSLFLFGMMGAFTVALSAGTLIAGAAAGLGVLLASRALMGIAQAGLFPASTRCIATWFPLDQRAFAAGTLQACMSIGAGHRGTDPWSIARECSLAVGLHHHCRSRCDLDFVVLLVVSRSTRRSFFGEPCRTRVDCPEFGARLARTFYQPNSVAKAG